MLHWRQFSHAVGRVPADAVTGSGNLKLILNVLGIMNLMLILMMIPIGLCELWQLC